MAFDSYNYSYNHRDDSTGFEDCTVGVEWDFMDGFIDAERHL
jgi:hypothetical protein